MSYAPPTAPLRAGKRMVEKITVERWPAGGWVWSVADGEGLTSGVTASLTQALNGARDAIGRSIPETALVPDAMPHQATPHPERIPVAAAGCDNLQCRDYGCARGLRYPCSGVVYRTPFPMELRRTLEAEEAERVRHGRDCAELVGFSAE